MRCRTAAMLLFTPLAVFSLRSSSIAAPGARMPLALTGTRSTLQAPVSPLRPGVVRPRALDHDSGAQVEPPSPVARVTGFASATDGTRIYYERLGSGPAIALIHGLGGNHAVWYPIVPALARDHTVIVLAQRGFAPSEGARDRFDVHVLAADLIAVLDAAGIERAAVVGQSMGGWTALDAAIEHPGRVTAVVLSDSIGGIFDDEIRAQYDITVERARRLGSSPPPLGMHPALDPSFSREHPELGYLYQLFSSFGSPPPGVIAQQLGQADLPHDALRKLGVPVLFIVGEKDEIFPPATVRRAASYVPGSRLMLIPGTGHSAYFEQPRLWRTALDDFLSQAGSAGDH